MFWKTNEEKKGKVRLEGCLDTSKDHIQHCSHGIRTDWICSQCEKTKSEDDSLKSSFDEMSSKTHNL